MPYFIFRINNHREYMCMEQHASYRGAKTNVRKLRADTSDTAGVANFRMVFAENETDAEHLLKAKKEQAPSGVD